MSKRNVSVALLCLLAGAALNSFQCAPSDYSALIDQGEFNRAARIIQEKFEDDPNLSAEEQLQLEFELERMDRIRKDFTQSRDDLMEFINLYIPDATEADFRKWEDSRALEYMLIDGEKKYFKNAQYNLFRIDKDARAIKAQKDSVDGTAKVKEFPLDEHICSVIETARNSGMRNVKPVTLRIKQSITVNENIVPEGEVIRAWIPFPREIQNRQGNIHILSTSGPDYIIADNDRYLQRTIYFQQKASKNEAAEFFIEYEYTVYGVYAPISADRVRAITDESEFRAFLQVEPPHIVFTDELRELSKTIVGDERNPYLIAQKLFEWVDVNIPWASAREYSTIRNLSMYPYINRHGDCGIQTLMFITLCRLNGIPAKWQSGWEFQPPDNSMHDWGEIYFEPFGWVPMDVTYGVRDTQDEAHKWFYVNGMDSYRLIFNDAISQEFFPAKTFPRSETVDSQRGEVEWSGGNLYFDQWDWNLEWEVIAE